MAEREVVLLLLLFGFAASSYWKKPEYSREVPDTKMLLLAKPAFVPFTERDAAVLVHVEERLLRRCLSKDDSLPAVIRLRDERGLLSVETTIEDSAPEKTIDRFGREWLHVAIPSEGEGGRVLGGFGSLPIGATKLYVSACGETVHTKLVKAIWREGTTFTVDNIRGHLVAPGPSGLGLGGPGPAGSSHSSGLPFLPFGSYMHLTDGSQAALEVPDMEVKFGMNWVGPYLSEAGGHSNSTWARIMSFLDRCHQIGVKVHYDLHALATLPDTPTKWDLLKREVEMVMHHPAVAVYYLADEPGGQGVDPSILDKAYDFVKGMDPNRPISEVFCCVDPAKYIDSFDIGMADPYPIPNSSPFYVTFKTTQLVATGKPFFIVVQAFGGGELWERNPTPAEERSMTYLAMLSGAVGIQYFIRSPGQFPYSATAWSECRRLALEFREMSSAILNSQGGGGKGLNVTLSVGQGVVLATGWEERMGGAWVVAAVSYINEPNYVTLTTNTSYSGPATVLFQNRNVTVVDGEITDVILGYGSVAYRFPPITSSGVSPMNMLSNPSFEEVTSASTPDGAYLGVPADQASTYLTDTSLSVDGLHSLQLTTPTKSGGHSVQPYPVSLTAGTSYELSFRAISATPELTLQFTFADMTPASASYQTKTTWTKYSTIINATTTSHRDSFLHYQLVSNGTVWLDLLQLIPQTD